MAHQMTEGKAAQGFFEQGFDCSQMVLSEFCESLGMDKTTALKASAAFGGGIWQGEVCGCVSGALMAVGLKYGHHLPGDGEAKQQLCAKLQEFCHKFAAANGSLLCRELLGYNIGVPEEMQLILDKGLLQEKCPRLAVSACDILDEVLNAR